jgi:hypothetical protein
MKSDKQQLIDNLQELESLTRSLAHTYVKNLAHDEVDINEAETLLQGLSWLSGLASETVLLAQKIRVNGGFNQLSGATPQP